MKKLLSIILIFVMLCSTFAGLQITSNADDLPSSGSCGENVTYTFDSATGLLTISGSGAMKNYSSSSSNQSPFYNQTSIKKVVINSGVTSIGYNAFCYCSGLTSVTIPNSVTSIGNYAFIDCTGLTSITIPDSVTRIVGYAFYNCSGLKSVTIGNSVTSIGCGAFENCSKLTSITIPNSVKIIDSYAFSDCSGLTSITIPGSVTNICKGAFSCCGGLKSITVAESNIFYDSRNHCNAIIESKTNTLISGCKNTVIPNSVTSIGGSAFSSCTGLTSITIPDSVTSIGDWAFNNCSKLTSITIPNSVTSIGDWAFSYCSGLTSITIPNSVTSIGSGAFWYCTGLTSITIPNSVTSIGEDAFYCTSNNLKVTASCENLFVNNIIKGTNRTWNKQHGADSAVEVVPSTCTAKGYTTHTCSVCGDNYKDTYTNALGHNNKSVTTKAKINANGKIVTTCKRCGVSSTKTIYYPKTISLSKTAFSYNKKVQKPRTTVYNSKGQTISSKYYKVTYSRGCKNVGKYTVKVTFKGNYSGFKSKVFLIRPAVSPTNKALLSGQSFKIKTSSSKGCIFGSSNKKVATVNKKGVVTAKSAGTAKIVVKSNGVANTVTVKVVKPGITLNKSSVVIFKGRSATIKAKTYPSKYKVKWSTSNSRVATVSGGKVKGVGTGKAYITAKITIAGITYKKSCKVVVRVLGAPAYSAQCSDYGRLRVTFPKYYNYNYLQVQFCIDKSFNDNLYNVIDRYDYSQPYLEYYCSSGKTYYVRARQYTYDNNGNIVYSPWGKRIKVYVK